MVALGLRPNIAQFSLLVVVNAFVGAMVGMERSILPAIAEKELHLAARAAILSFIVVFGLSKAITNWAAGRASDLYGRKRVLVVGWLVATPVPFILMVAPTWTWILAANVLLGVSQGLTWSTTVIMKIDLAGPAQRGLAMGLNELAGYLAVALSALATGWIAARYGLRPAPFWLGVGYVVCGLFLSVVLVQETRGHATHEAKTTAAANVEKTPRSARGALALICQSGLVNNLNDGMAWGLFPLVYAEAGKDLRDVATLAAIYPAVWGGTQLFTGALSDRIGRKLLVAFGMIVQAIGIVLTAYHSFVIGAVLLGLGTAMVYPTLLAAIGDVAAPSWRASAVGTYRFYRDLGYAVGALVAGFVADAFGVRAAVLLVAAITFASGTVTAIFMRETRTS